MRSLMICIAQSYSSDQIEKNEMGGACRRYGERVWGEVYIGFWWGNLGDRDHLDDPVVDGRIILR